MSTVDCKYINFYSKKQHAIRLPFKPLLNNLNITRALDLTGSLPFGLNKNTICIYNPFSLSNIIRKNESNRIYLNEADKITASTNELKDTLFTCHKNLSKNNLAIMSNLQKCQVMYDAEYPNADKSVYGLTAFEFVFDVSQHSAKYYIDMFVRKADLLNYNYVDYSVDVPHDVIFNGKTYKCARACIQFEASYQDKIRLDLQNYIYHVTIKNAADKIMKYGLLPANKNVKGFHYKNRVYLFTQQAHDMNAPISYAVGSGKINKKFFTYNTCSLLVNTYKKLEYKKTGIVVDTREFTILQIDLKKIPNVKFYRDNTYESNGIFFAVFTEQPIKPQAIIRRMDFIL